MLSKNLVIILCALLLSSCVSSKKTLYFQDVEDSLTQSIVSKSKVVIDIDDKLSIVVTCSNLESAAEYNAPMMGSGGSFVVSSASSENVANGYFVDSSGNIKFPQLGTVEAKGLTPVELSRYLEKELSQYLKDPTVTVQFMNFKISILGDVKRPKTITVKSGRITILEALSQAGDLNILAKRNSVMIIREKNDVRDVARLDLRSKELFDSEFYYLQQNDVIYIEPSGSTIFSNEANAILPYLATVISSIATIIALTK